MVKAAGLDLKQIAPHTLRHTASSTLSRGGLATGRQCNEYQATKPFKWLYDTATKTGNTFNPQWIYWKNDTKPLVKQERKGSFFLTRLHRNYTECGHKEKGFAAPCRKPFYLLVPRARIELARGEPRGILSPCNSGFTAFHNPSLNHTIHLAIIKLY